MSTPPKMSDHLIRKVPDDLWQRVKARATAEQLPLRQLLLHLLRSYADGDLSISIQAKKG